MENKFGKLRKFHGFGFMNILITGAAGFVGRALFRELLSRKYPLTCVFRKLSRETQKTIEFNGCRQFVVENIDGTTRWSTHLTDVDQIVHLAGQAHVPYNISKQETNRFFWVNHEGTRNLAAQAARQGVKRFVFMSSILVNGSQSPLAPFCETDRANPQNAYAAAKYEAEKSLEKIGAETGMEVVILRPPLVYGPGVKANFLKLMNLVYAGIPMPLGEISNRRSFIGLKNLVDAVCLCIEHEKAGNQTFLVSDGEDLSTSQLITTIAVAMGRPCRLFAMPDKFVRTGLSLLGRKNVYGQLWGTLQVDSSKIRSRLGWHPPVPMDRGIAETAHWYLNNRQRHTRLNA
jgi:nucleoside-diphosphate-sugar epimerase